MKRIRIGAGKRWPDVPATSIYSVASKADILEAAWDLASLCNDSGSADDTASTFQKLLDMINLRRAQRGAKPLKLKG